MSIDSEAIASDVQYLAPGQLIELFELDATDIGAIQVYYFTMATSAGAAIEFNGIEYTPLDFEIEGLQISGTGQLPEPTIRLSNTDNALGAAINSFNDLVGAKLTRRRTFAKYLDGEPGADPTAQFPLDIFVVEQKTAQNKYFVEFKLVPFMDYQGIRIPKRQVLRDNCPFVYRTWTVSPSGFNYDNVIGCPYTDTNYFDYDGGVEGLPEDDICGKRLSDCTLRFPGDDAEVPFGGFPSVAKIRIR